MANIQYRSDIDGLRAVAVLAVLGFHAFPSLFPGGFVGVDIFFVISGYLITSILLQDSKQSGIRISTFYAKRILRIFPALILVLASCLFFGWYTLLGSEYMQLGKHILSGAGFASNVVLWFESNYFDNASVSKPLLHLWSLGIEEQFYIVWPLALAVCVRLRRPFGKWLVAALLISLVYSCIMVMQDRTASFYSPFSRAWELLAGSLLAYLPFTGRKLPAVCVHSSASLFGLALIVLSIAGLDASDRFPGLLAVPPVLGAALLIAANPMGTVHARILSNAWMVRVGRISYPLYLWHWPLLSFATILLAKTPSWHIRLYCLLAALALAFFTFECIEKPVRKLPRRLSIGLLCAGMLFLALLGKNILDRDGLASIRYKTIIALNTDAQKDFIDWEKSGLITEKSCEIPFQFPGRSYCLTRYPERPPTAAVIGDSHAFHAYWGLAQALGQEGENLTAIGRGACIPFMGFSRGADEDKCQPHMDQMMTYAVASPNIKKVFLIFRGRYLPNTASKESAMQFRDGLERTLNTLKQSGKRVYYFLPVVEAGFDPRLCLGGLPFGRNPPNTCVLSRSSDALNADLLRSEISVVLSKHPEVRVIDPNAFLCEADACKVVRDGHTMFKDENHISYAGSLFLGQAMLERIMAAD
jgi:peptidoglycan/LPS O-acetylase OafA/YrhL